GDSAKEETSWSQQALKFLIERNTKLAGIVPDPIDTYIYVAHNRPFPDAVVEGEDVGIVVMLQVAAVQIEQVGVRAEDKVDFSQLDLLLGGDPLEPLRGLTGMGNSEIRVFAEIADGRCWHQELI